MVATRVPTATRTVGRQDRGKWQMGSGPNDGKPRGNTDCITLVLSNDDGGYTGGGLPDETVLAVLRLSCDLPANSITAMVLWFEEVIIDPTWRQRQCPFSLMTRAHAMRRGWLGRRPWVPSWKCRTDSIVITFKT